MQNGGRLVGAVQSGGLFLFDIANKSRIVLLSQYESSGISFGVSITSDDNYILLADGGRGVKILQILFDNSFSLISSFDSSGYSYKVSVNKNNDAMAVGDDTGGILILDIS